MSAHERVSADPLPWRLRLGVALGAPLIRALSATWRVRVEGRAAVDAARARGEPVIFAIWHGQMLAGLSQHVDEGVSVLISEHRDGEIIARIVRALGYAAVRGSTSRGGSRALLELAALLREGRDVAITPDGPRGPAKTYAPGALVAAHRGGGAIVPVLTHADRAWRLPSWDRFEIPKPFARVAVVYGAPERVEAASARDAAEQASAAQARMVALAERARALVEGERHVPAATDGSPADAR